jgi:4-aminobutyrate aminotransferase-like enzyme
MFRQFNLAPRDVGRIDTTFRQIVTPIPAPDSVPVVESLRCIEPVAMQGQPPIVWNRAEGFQVFDGCGNKWIDWSSGVVVANAGHGRREVIEAIQKQAGSGLLTNYCFPNEPRALLLRKLSSLLPDPLKKIFLLTTGSETVECAIKLCRTWGAKSGGRHKNAIISFQHAFHGRTLGAQLAGGIPALKEWIVNEDPGFVQIPFPDGWRNPHTSFENFEQDLRNTGVEPANVAGVIMETYQGGSAAFAPVEYMKALRQWCSGHRALLVLDEVQAAFGRCGTFFGWEHYGIVPDVACFGKGISGSLPISAVAGRADVMDLHAPNSMTSTHTGNPVCCAAALASIDLILKENLAGNAQCMGKILHSELAALRNRIPRIGRVEGKVFAPVGYGGGTIKICPPLVITEPALRESLGAFSEAFHECLQLAPQ